MYNKWRERTQLPKDTKDPSKDCTGTLKTALVSRQGHPSNTAIHLSSFMFWLSTLLTYPPHTPATPQQQKKLSFLGEPS